MKSIKDFRNILLEEEKPNFSPADRMIVQNLFNKMVDLISNNKQIFQQTRRAVREDIVDTSDFKIDKSGRKYKAHRIKLGDNTPAVADGTVELAKEEVVQLTEAQDPPFVLVLKRKAIRLYPDGTRIALYHNDRLDKDFAVPYATSSQPVIQAEAVDAMGQLQKIKDSHQHGTVNHKDGSASKVDVQTAHAILTVHKNLNDENKKKFSDMVARSAHHMQKAAEFSWKSMK